MADSVQTVDNGTSVNRLPDTGKGKGKPKPAAPDFSRLDELYSFTLDNGTEQGTTYKAGVITYRAENGLQGASFDAIAHSFDGVDTVAYSGRMKGRNKGDKGGFNGRLAGELAAQIVRGRENV